MKHTLWERFWAKVDPCRTDGCYIWTGARGPTGYGRIFLWKKDGVSHFVFSHHVLAGVPLRGLHIDHVRSKGCFNKACVNPEHLEVVTPRENSIRANAGEHYRIRDACKHGHKYSESPPRIYKNARICRECERIRSTWRWGQPQPM